jgi:hypothetical protein
VGFFGLSTADTIEVRAEIPGPWRELTKRIWLE